MFAIVKNGVTANSSVGFTLLDFFCAALVVVFVALVFTRTPEGKYVWGTWDAAVLLILFGVALLVFSLLFRW